MVDVDVILDLKEEMVFVFFFVRKMLDCYVLLKIIVEVIDFVCKNGISVGCDDFIKKVNFVFCEGCGKCELIFVVFNMKDGVCKFYCFKFNRMMLVEFFDVEGYLVLKFLFVNFVLGGRFGDGFVWCIYFILYVCKYYDGVDYVGFMGLLIFVVGDGIVEFIFW